MRLDIELRRAAVLTSGILATNRRSDGGDPSVPSSDHLSDILQFERLLDGVGRTRSRVRRFLLYANQLKYTIRQLTIRSFSDVWIGNPDFGSARSFPTFSSLTVERRVTVPSLR